ncbi:nuclear transport factor 2 family protein [Streptomyces sp.]|uniref:nuclear transport factor 2 family protein n=1 Tax=Streptomyces sp. TaxID=1931 RepID=UPI0028115D72|nr:nuclear transport factor 2 family protein [Streptomyces sp.]
MSRTAVPGTDARLDDATEVFPGRRELLSGIVHNMLGSVADTDDVPQETWPSWTARGAGASLDGVANPRACLVRVALNHALERRAATGRGREPHVGPWLPEPLVTDEDAGAPALRAESVSLAMPVVLESPTPLERAVFVPGEVFGYPHAGIAEIIDRTPAAVRQPARRSREHVHARRPRFRAHPRVGREATERFVRAALGGDTTALMEILAPDVTVWTDGGGKRKPAALRPAHGRDKAARPLGGYASGRGPRDLELRHRRVNGDDAAVLFRAGSPFAAVVLDLTPDGGQVCGVYVVADPDKLTHVRGEEA